MQTTARRHIYKMIDILYLSLVIFQFVRAQTALSATNSLPSAPANVVPSIPAPLGNTALWQQAVTFDAASNITGNYANQYFYSSVAWWQSLENRSNSYLSGSSSSVDAGPYISQCLQAMQIYPTRFDQAQASDPQRITSKQGPNEFSSVIV